MNEVLVYSFRTNKHLDVFKKANVPVFTFGKLKEDLVKFEKLVLSKSPKLIVGLAEVSSPTRIEKVTINAFGKDKKINKSGKDKYVLHIPEELSLMPSRSSTDSFCNWTAYKISELLEGRSTKNTFIHFNVKDLEKVINFLKS